MVKGLHSTKLKQTDDEVNPDMRVFTSGSVNSFVKDFDNLRDMRDFDTNERELSTYLKQKYRGSEEQGETGEIFNFPQFQLSFFLLDRRDIQIYL